MKNALDVTSGLLMIVAYIAYGRSMMRQIDSTKPSKATWLVWSILDTITFSGMLTTGKLNGQTVGNIVGIWVITILAFRHGKPGWTWLEKLCLSGAALGLGLWWFYHSPVLGIVVSNSVLLLGSLPTFAKAWHDPRGEDALSWAIFWLACVPAIGAIPIWTMADAAQPIAFTIIDTVMMAILFLRLGWWQKTCTRYNN